MKLALHRCRDCGRTFADGRAFEAHGCVTKLKGKSLAELKAMLASRKPPEPKP